MLSVRTDYRTSKENESITDCQDHLQANAAKNCFAIADGASQSFYPSIWAKLLVENFCKDHDIHQGNWKKWLQLIQKDWSSEVKKRVEEAKSEGKPTWVTNQNRLNSRVPATSTFIGLQFLENPNHVKASIVGDSCLFVVKGHELKKKYPLEKSSDFNDRPEYFASYANHNEYPPKFLDIHLDYKESSEPLYFILATDALSEYIFKCKEGDKGDIFKILLEITSEEKFKDFVSQARNSSSIKMKNDDVALMILSVSNATILESPSQLTDTTKGDSEVPISKQFKKEVGRDDIKELKKEVVPQNNIKVLHIENRRLKHHRSALGALAVFCLLFIFVDQIISHRNSKQATNENQTDTPETAARTKNFETFNLSKVTNVYEDPQSEKILIKSSSNLLEVVAIPENNERTKFVATLYAHKSSLVKCVECVNEIKIKSGENIMVFPTKEIKSDNDIFGKLENTRKFKQLEVQGIKDWCAFKIV